MVSTLIENILVKTDTLLERFFRQPDNREAVSFRRYITDPRKILFVPGESLLDFSLIQRFILPLLEKFPLAEITVVLRPDQACLLDKINRVRVIPWDHRSPHPFDSVFRRTASLLRQENFDWGINFSDSGRSEALLTYYSEAKIRTGLPDFENDKYYNLVVKNIPGQESLCKRLWHIFHALQIEQPSTDTPLAFHRKEEEKRRAARFIRRRKSSRVKDNFIGFVPEWNAGQKGLERLLHSFLNELIKEFDPLHLLVAGNLAPAEQMRKWEEASPYVYFFDDLRQMLTTLASCDRIITNSEGAACLLSSFGTRVGLVGAAKECLSCLEREELENIRVLKSDEGSFPLKQAINFTR